MNSTRAKTETPPVSKEKPKKRSLVERELETTLTPRLTSPLEPTEGGVTKSRYGRALRLKSDAEFCDTDKAVSKVLQTPTLTYLPNKAPQSYKFLVSNKQEQTQSPKNALCNLDSQIENIYNANISLSRFGTEAKHKQNSPSLNQKISKVYMRKDLLQTKEKEKTVTLIQNMFSPAKSAKKPSSHLNNVLERSSEKYSIVSNNPGTKQSGSQRKSIPKAQNSLNLNTASVVKTLDFDSKKKKKNDCGEKVLSKNELFELEAASPYQIGDLAWARMGTFPFWPCIVTREPGSELFVKKKLFGMVEHYIIHVTFFADNGRRSWIIDNMLRKYQGLDEFEAARDSFTPEAKKKDPKLYWAFFISDKKLALWHTSIEEADSLLREPRRLRIDLLNEMLMNPPRLKLTPSKPQLPQVPRSGKITNRNDSDVSLSESLYDTLFSVEDGYNETPRKQRNKSLDVSDVVTACLDNMAAKTGITKIQRQSHMDIWLQKAKSKTPEKSQLNINVSVERVEDVEKEPKKDNNNRSRRKKWVSPREPSHKPYSFRKSTESRHLLACHNEHDYSNPEAEPNQNANATGTETPPICVIDQVVSLKGIENIVHNEIITNEVCDNLITEETILQFDESTKPDEVDKAAEKTSNDSAKIILQNKDSTKENIVDKATEKPLNDSPNTILQDEESTTQEKVDDEPDNIRNKSTIEVETEIESSDSQIIEKYKLRNKKSVNKQKNIRNKSTNKVETKIERSDSQIIEKSKLNDKKSFNKSTDFEEDKESERILLKIDEMLEGPKHRDNALEKETIACESPTFTQPFDDFIWAGEQQPIDQLETVDEQDTNTRSVVKEIAMNKITSSSQSAEKASFTIESQPKTLSDRQDAVLNQSKENNKTTIELENIQPVENESSGNVNESNDFSEKQNTVTKNENNAYEVDTIVQPDDKATSTNASATHTLKFQNKSIRCEPQKNTDKTNLKNKPEVLVQSTKTKIVEVEPHIVAKATEDNPVANESQIVTRYLHREIVAKGTRTNVHSLNGYESDKEQDFDDCESEESEPSPEYEPLEKITPEEFNICPALLKEMSKDPNDLVNKSKLNEPNNVLKLREKIATLSDTNLNFNMSIDDNVRIKTVKQNAAASSKSKVCTTDDDRTTCNTNLVSEWDTSFHNDVDISPYERDFIIQSPVNKLTEITETSDQLITLKDLLNKQPINDYVNNIRETEKSIKRKSKVNKKIFDEPIDEIITIIEHQDDKDSVQNRNRKYVTRASKANKDQYKEKSISSTVQRETSINDTVLNNDIKSKVPKIKDRPKKDNARSKKYRSEPVINIVNNASHPEENINAEKEPIQKLRIKIADITVANSSIVLNGVGGPNDKQDPVLVEDSVCDTYSLRSEISSLNLCGDDTNDKDFDPETISLSSLSSVISDASAVAPRRLTRKTSFHEGRQKNVATNKDMDRIRQELLQDSDSESKSSSEDIALSEFITKTYDKTKCRNSLDSNKSDTSEKQLKVIVTDCLSKLTENKLPKVQKVSSETDVEYEIVNSPSAESFGQKKRISLRLKKTSPTKGDNIQNSEQKESPKPIELVLPEFSHLDLEPIARRNSTSVSKTAESQVEIAKDKLESPKTSLCEKSSDTEIENIDLTDLPLSLRRKMSSITKSLQLVISPLKTKSLSTESYLEDSRIKSTPQKKSSETNRIRKSLSSHPKSNPESKHRYPKRKSTALESLSTSLPKVSDAISQNVTSNESPAVVQSTSTKQNSNNKKETLQSKPAEPMVNGFHESRPSSPDVQLKEPELDTISIHSNDSVSSTKRKGKSKQEHERMKEPDFLEYLELRQDSLMDEHPELTYEEIIAYLYKTWQYEESRKSDIRKTEELENANLVKGINNEIVPKTKPKPKHKINRLININKVMSKVSPKQFETIDLLPRELPKRKTSKPIYKEEYSDIENEIEMFEIFKKKPKSTTPQVEPKKETEVAGDVKTEISSSEANTEFLPVIVSAKSEVLKAKTKDELKEPDEGETEEYYDQEELYFEQLTLLRPNVFKGTIREKVCEICEKTSNLVKCKGCNEMFHVECVRKVDKPVEVIAPTRGRKKKKKTRGRKPKYSLDSTEETHSDEKPQDLNASEEISFEDVKEVDPIIIIDVDNFESQLEAKMKEMIESVEIDCYSSDDGIDWSETVAGKCEIIDVKLKPRSQPILDNSNFKCKNCQEHTTPICFVCKRAVSPRDNIDRRQKCNVAHCLKYYHLECLEHWPQTQFNAGELSRIHKNNTELVEALACPRHVCHTCVCDDPRGCKTRFSGDKLARCVRCPATYHSFTKCLPAGSQILSASYIVCPRHYQHRPGKVPYHVNTGWCFICALGGKLICCDYCPTSFHADCLNIEPPEGGYMCEDCETGRLPLYGEMVWVKLGHYRWWPGIILHPSDIPENIMAVKHSPGEFVVRFFGQYDHYWVNRGRVFPFQEGDSGKTSAQKSKIDEAFTIAMEHAQRAFEILKNVEANDEESQDIQSSLLPPHYVKLKVNKPCGALYGKKVDLEESSLTQCECNPAEEEPCGPYSHCLNRMLLTECGPTCRAGERCQNRQFEKRQYPKLVPYRTPHRGWGLKTLEEIKAGQFVIEYVGELIDEAEFRRRMRRKHEVRDENYYFLTLDKERMIDAGPKGNLARFMNHCCEPNCETQKWTVLGDVRVGLFAIDDIPANTEVTFNYNLECTGIDKKECMCGAKRCAGYIGAKPKQEAPEPKKAKLPTKRVYKKRKTTDSPSASTSNANAKPKRPIGRPPKPKEPRELTEIEKDLLIIKNATNCISSDSETNSRRDSADIESDKIVKSNKIDRLTLKRKMVSFTADDEVECNGVTPPCAKKIRLDEEQVTVGD